MSSSASASSQQQTTYPINVWASVDPNGKVQFSASAELEDSEITAQGKTVQECYDQLKNSIESYSKSQMGQS